MSLKPLGLLKYILVTIPIGLLQHCFQTSQPKSIQPQKVLPIHLPTELPTEKPVFLSPSSKINFHQQRMYHYMLLK